MLVSSVPEYSATASSSVSAPLRKDHGPVSFLVAVTDNYNHDILILSVASYSYSVFCFILLICLLVFTRQVSLC